MTAGRDALRSALAEAVPEWAGLCDEEPLTLADALLPLVERFAAEQVAAALDDAAEYVDGSGLWDDQIARDLRARAAAVLAAGDRRQG